MKRFLLVGYILLGCLGLYWQEVRVGPGARPVVPDTPPAPSPASVGELVALEGDLAASLRRGGRPGELIAFRRRFAELGRRGVHGYRPEHFDRMADLLAMELGLPIEGTPELRGGLDYLYHDVGLPALLDLQARARAGDHHLNTAVDHALSNLASGERGEELLRVLEQALPGTALAGLDVVDVGGGSGVLAARLSDFVGHEGTVTVLEIDPAFEDLIRRFGRYDPRYRRLRFRLGLKESVNLPAESADVVYLTDVHMAGWTGAHAQGTNSWLTSIYRSLRSGGRVVLYECGDWNPPLRYVTEALRDTRFDLLQVQEGISQGTPGRKGYLVVARRPPKESGQHLPHLAPLGRGPSRP